jgi:hypothetical protein
MTALLRVFLMASVLLALAGCSTVTQGWAPIPSKDELESFSSRWERAPKTPAAEVTAMQRELVKYRDEIYARAAERSRLEWETSGFATYGGVATVLGALADRTGLLNAGAGLAGFGLTQSTRFRFAEQRQIYVAALGKLFCITGKVNSANDVSVALARGSSDPNAQDAALRFSDKVVASVDAVRVEYTNALFGLTPGVPSREELTALFNRYRVPAVAVSGGDPMQQAKDAAGVAVLGLTDAIQTCAK